VLIFTLGFALKGVYPFGENSALVVDGVHQYTAFYRELSEQLGKGAGWTWSAHAMGYNFYGLFCYYLCSPFSFLVLLFMKFMYVNEAVTAVILIKAGLCSVSMAWYSGKKYPGRGLYGSFSWVYVCTVQFSYGILQQCDVAGLYHASSGSGISY
jgi:uncharacterized membrane protein YfhO